MAGTDTDIGGRGNRMERPLLQTLGRSETHMGEERLVLAIDGSDETRSPGVRDNNDIDIHAAVGRSPWSVDEKRSLWG